MNEQHISLATIKWLCDRFDLPAPDEFCQDWENENASPALITSYLEVYGNENLPNDQKAGVMALLLSSANAALAEGAEMEDAWQRIKALLKRDVSIHRNLMDEWSSWDHSQEEMDDAFALTPLVRQVLREVSASE